VPATTRASLGIYNTKDDIDALVAGLGKAKEMFA
jgi:cysteine desulfurase/selenocysteine lyase